MKQAVRTMIVAGFLVTGLVACKSKIQETAQQPAAQPGKAAPERGQQRRPDDGGPRRGAEVFHREGARDHGRRRLHLRPGRQRHREDLGRGAAVRGQGRREGHRPRGDADEELREQDAQPEVRRRLFRRRDRQGGPAARPDGGAGRRLLRPAEQTQLPEGAHPKLDPEQAAKDAKVSFDGIKKAGKTVGDVYAGQADLGGKEVTVRGKVVKFSPQIMGKNWVHVQDGTGQAGGNDLTVTTLDERQGRRHGAGDRQDHAEEGFRHGLQVRPDHRGRQGQGRVARRFREASAPRPQSAVGALVFRHR